MKAEKSQDLQSPGQRPWRVQAQVKTWRAEDKFQSKSEDKRKPMSQFESNHAERENSSLPNLFVLFSPTMDRIDVHPHWGRAICFLSIDSNFSLIQNHSLGHTRNNALSNIWGLCD